MGTLKKKNRKILVGYIIVNLILFSLLSNNFFIDSSSLSNMLTNPLDPSLISVLLLFALSIVLEGVISSKVKAIIIFNRIKYPLPGCRAFTKIALSDERINIKKLNSLYDNNPPSQPSEQNSEWYRIFQLYKDNNVIQDSHKSYLLTRDLLALSIILFLLSTVFHFIIGTANINILYSVGLYLVVIILLKLSAYNYGRRFTANVLVAHLNSKNIG